MEMWKVPYAKEPFDVKLNLMLLAKKWWVLLVSSILGVLLVGGPYFLKHVVYAPARAYEMVLDFKIDYAENSAGEEYTYFNQSTWYQLLKDDVFTDKVLANLQANNHVIADNASGSDGAPLTKDDVKGFMEGTLLSDTRIVTATVRTHNPELTAQVADALEKAFYDFGEETKEIDVIHTWQKPEQATLVVRDIRLFRACILGLILFDFVTLLVMLCKTVLDDSIYVPSTFEKRYHVPMIGWLVKTENGYRASKQMKQMTRGLVKEEAALVITDATDNVNELQDELKKQGAQITDVVIIGTDSELEVEQVTKLQNVSSVLVAIKAAHHNGKAVEYALDTCSKLGHEVDAAVLYDVDELVINYYYLPSWSLADSSFSLYKLEE